MTPYWFKPQYQPDPEKPIEFQLKQLTVRQGYEALATRYPNGMLHPDVQQQIFLQNVLDWRGIDTQCNQPNRMAVCRAEDSIFGHSLGTWLVWTMETGDRLAREAMLTDDELKNL